MRAAALAAFGVALAAAFTGAPALANGRFPASGQVVVDPADHDHLVLRATFGVLRSRDRGKSWGWICESAVGYSGTQDPMMGIAKGGAILAGSFQGLAISRDDGCGWTTAGGPLAGTISVDLSVRAADPTDVIALALGLDGGGAAPAVILRSHDAGATFTPLGALPDDLVALTIDAAPSAPDTVYVSGRFGAPDYPGSILRSDDGGATFQRFDIAGALDRSAYIAAIAPDDPATVYVRLDGAPGDELVVTHDGGETWASLFQGQGDLLAFALAPDGSALVIGGESDGLWGSATSAPAFTKVSSITARCATWTTEGLYACADEIADGFSLGLSKDGGATMTPVMHLAATCGPLDCAAAACGGEWPALAARLGNPSCAEPDAGSGGMPSAPPETSPSGCTCNTASPPDGALPVALAAALALTASRRRSRRAATGTIRLKGSANPRLSRGSEVECDVPRGASCPVPPCASSSPSPR